MPTEPAPAEPGRAQPARTELVRQVVLTEDGPVLLSGPVELVLPDGRRVTSQRPVTALCVCRRSRRYPFCDTSHRTKVRTTAVRDDPC